MSVSTDEHFHISTSRRGKLLHGDSSFAAQCGGSCCRTGSTAPRCAQGSGKGHGRQLFDHIQNPQSLQGQDLISPREDTSDINSHTIADVSQKHQLHKIQECNTFFPIKSQREIYVCDDVAKPLEKGAFYFSCVSQMGPYSKSSLPSSPISSHYD